MLLSAVSVLVVAQSSSEIPEGLMNNPVLKHISPRNAGSSQYVLAFGLSNYSHYINISITITSKLRCGTFVSLAVSVESFRIPQDQNLYGKGRT